MEQNRSGDKEAKQRRHCLLIQTLKQMGTRFGRRSCCEWEDSRAEISTVNGTEKRVVGASWRLWAKNGKERKSKKRLDRLGEESREQNRKRKKRPRKQKSQKLWLGQRLWLLILILLRWRRRLRLRLLLGYTVCGGGDVGRERKTGAVALCITGAEDKYDDQLAVVRRRDVIGLALAFSSLLTQSFDAEGAGTTAATWLGELRLEI
ncbi:hypothetical protein F0562_001322 [Nyssa sinensis]|uniref:Uncharacterized protein n=1 Tax=Nyssa sinensis TaxID=561372 RepID=A0A5J5C6R8_9ASTE|nr:hypothetical protein F0562_001322 [Nyssa sinensis]